MLKGRFVIGIRVRDGLAADKSVDRKRLKISGKKRPGKVRTESELQTMKNKKYERGLMGPTRFERVIPAV